MPNFKESTPKQRWAQRRNWAMYRLRNSIKFGTNIIDQVILCETAEDEMILALFHLRKTLKIFKAQPISDSFKAWTAKEGIKIPE